MCECDIVRPQDEHDESDKDGENDVYGGNGQDDEHDENDENQPPPACPTPEEATVDEVPPPSHLGLTRAAIIRAEDVRKQQLLCHQAFAGSPPAKGWSQGTAMHVVPAHQVQPEIFQTDHRRFQRPRTLRAPPARRSNGVLGTGGVRPCARLRDGL